MPATKITELTAISTVNTTVDPLPIVDVSDTTQASSGTTKKITVSQIDAAIFGTTGSKAIVVDNVAALKALTVSGIADGQLYITRGYYSDNDGGQGAYIYDSASAASDNGGTVIAPTAGSGRFLLQYSGELNVKQFGAKGDGVTNDAPSIIAAITASKASESSLTVPDGTYSISGSTGLDVDIGKMSMCGSGVVIFDCSALTATNAIQVYSSLSYPNSHYTNTINKLSGIVFKGGSVAGRHGLLIGSASYANNGQTLVERCGFVNFDRCHHFTSNAWRCVFNKCVFMTAVNYTMYWPSGVSNAGEAISYYHCQFNDGTGSMLVAANNVNIYMFSCSILNQPITISGFTVLWIMFGGNMENPANATPYTYITISNASTFVMNGTGLVLDALATFTDAIFNLSSSGSSLIFNNVIWPDGSNLQFETTVGWRTFAKGSGRVVVNGSSYWPLSGGYKCPVSASANSIYNGNFETGNTDGWSVAAYSTAGSTAVASATAKKNGTYGLLVTTVSGGGINITQDCKVKPGQLVQLFAWIKVATAGSAPIGYFQLAFFSATGNQISIVSNEISSTSWTAFGSSQTGYAPAGADYCKVVINVQTGGPNVVYVDDVILNIG